MWRDKQSIQDMWNAAQEILSFTEGMDYAALEFDRRTQAAVLYEIVKPNPIIHKPHIKATQVHHPVIQRLQKQL